MPKTVAINQDKLLMLKETVASNEFVSHIPFLYHATPSCYVDSIKEFGLGGKIPEKRFWSYKGTPYENIKYGVFLATDEYVAESYLEASEEFEELCEKYEEDLEIVVFRINTNDLDLSLLSEDENQTQEGDESERTYFYNGIIPFENLEKITLYENVIKEAAPEVDEYEIGDEGSNPPVGGNFYHVNESYGNRVMGDLSMIDTVIYIAHDDPRFECDDEEEYTSFEPYYDLEAKDKQGNTILCGDIYLSELDDYFPQGVITDIIEKNGRKQMVGAYRDTEEYWIEDICDRYATPNNLDDVEEVNAIAKKIQTGGPSGFILIDGDVISFHDHYYINSIDGMTIGRFLNLGNIRIGASGGIEIIQKPNNAQINTLKSFSRANDGNHYLDIAKYKEGSFYPEHVCSAQYKHANPNRLINDILNYFDNGIKPQGNNFYESKENDSEVIIENTFEKWFGSSILKDENGQPLKMYHGTDAEFDTFSKEHIGRTGAYEGYGFNFTPFESRARGYNSINVIEAYLKVENPMTTKSHKITLNKLIKIISELDKGKPFTDTIVAAYEPARYNEKWDAMYYRRALPIAAKIIYNYNKENNYGDAGLYAEICLCGQSDKIETINVFERLGYDSAIFYDNNDRINTVIVFEPNQIKRTSNKTFNIDSDSMNEQMTNENFDFEVDSSEIDLSSFKKKHELVPNIWNPDGKLNSRIRLKLLDIADDFWEYANLTWVKPSGIILTGSICNFNWSQYSDIDLHLIVDFNEIDEKTEFVKDYLDSKKNEWNNEHENLQIMGYPVELYVQNLEEMPESNGIYDLEENDWVREPDPDDIKSIGLNKFSIKDKAAKIMTIIDDMYDTLASTDDSHEIEQMGEDASYLWKKVKEMRKSSLEKNGESGSGNICYKYMRRMGYLDKLWKLRTLCYDKTNSIFENESIKKYLTLLKESMINEEWVGDGNSEHNPYKKRWDAERKALKDFVSNYGKLMQSRENGKLYKCYYDKVLSQLVGFNYCICIQWDNIEMKPKSILYIRALDKFTPNIKQVNFDYRGRDNQIATADDLSYRNY